MNSWSYCGLPLERKCEICKKDFCARDEWVYVRGVDSHRKWFCSWKCLRKYDAKQEERKKKPCQTKDEILQMLAEGKNAKEISEELGIRQAMVYYYDLIYGTSNVEE